MKARELHNMGFPKGPVTLTALATVGNARVSGQSNAQVRSKLHALLRSPERFKDDPLYGKLANALIESKPFSGSPEHEWEEHPPLEYKVWGNDIDEQAHQQMRNACRLPISVAAALMPDAHVGYGLPIGGVLATDNAVIPYAVGVDIACRMMMTVFPLPPKELQEDTDRFKRILERNTRFGIGAEWKPRRDHPVMDEDWSVSPITAKNKDLAHRQLGTSGSGNHFVEFGELEVLEPVKGLAPGKYLAVLSHSGSRGTGAKVADHYSRWAMSQHGGLPSELRHLSWLDLAGDGAEYWAAMELMGKYASANHHVIHRQIVEAVGEDPLLQVENHHNFAWKEMHNGREVIVHRKGATPAAPGVLGIIPGSMASPGYVVEGKGNPESLHSAAHGAGRRMGRNVARKSLDWKDVNRYLREKGVTLLSAGLDEAPYVYKDIEAVMAAQHSLVRPLAKFMPRLVKMAPGGERPED
ncbi:MAG TPA: RtcB family protein [Phycisphaerae bacterium]|nr:RtcB family protein [Phycisphaerae bacterium]